MHDSVRYPVYSRHITHGFTTTPFIYFSYVPTDARDYRDDEKGARKTAIMRDACRKRVGTMERKGIREMKRRIWNESRRCVRRKNTPRVDRRFRPDDARHGTFTLLHDRHPFPLSMPPQVTKTMLRRLRYYRCVIERVWENGVPVLERSVIDIAALDWEIEDFCLQADNTRTFIEGF